MKIRIMVFCIMGEYQRYRERYCLHLQDNVNVIPLYIRHKTDQRFSKFESLLPRAVADFHGLFNDAFGVETAASAGETVNDS